MGYTRHNQQGRYIILSVSKLQVLSNEQPYTTQALNSFPAGQ